MKLLSIAMPKTLDFLSTAFAAQKFTRTAGAASVEICKVDFINDEPAAQPWFLIKIF